MQQLMGALAEQVDFTRSIVIFALVMARMMAIVVLVPFLGGKNAPMEVKMGVGVTLTILLWPTVLANLDPNAGLPLNPLGFLLMMMKETFVGLVIGFVASKVFYIVEIAGQLMDMLRGANQIQLQVPEIEERSSAFGALNFQLLLALFLALDLHRPFIASLFESFVAVPLNDFPHFQAGFGAFLEYNARITADIIAIAVLIAMPMGIVTLITETVFGLINRVAPQINAYFMAMPAKVIGGCIVFFLSVDLVLEQMITHSVTMLEHVDAVIELME
jgi:flagellar biosynthesis protein FliR